jgi:hypothetical protein
MTDKIKVTVWNEFVHEKIEPKNVDFGKADVQNA